MTDDPIWWIKAVAVFVVVAVVAPLVAAVTAMATILYLPLPAPDLPQPKPGAESRITRIVDSTGKEFGVLRKFDTAIPVKPADIPEVLKQAVVAAEDQRFYSHSGFDLPSAIRAAWADLRGRTVTQGGSTITQQYIKNTYTGGERTFSRKVREAVLANRLDRKATKDEILYRYLSSIYLGGGAYGVGAAAESYFAKPVKDLSLSEAALLAGLIPAPSQYEPRSNPTTAEARRTLVLNQMLEQGRISSSQHSEAISQRIFVVGRDGATPDGPATVVRPIEGQSTTEPYYYDMVRRYLEAKYPNDLVYRGGLRVETALDPKLQELAERTVSKALSGTQPPLEMALATVEPGSGFIKAIVGGRDFTKSTVNLALGRCPDRPEGTAPPADGPVCLGGGGTGRQPGSSFKPFTLARAFEEGIGPSRVFSGPGTYTFPNCTGKGCTVKNVESGSYGSISLRSATQNSVNTVFAQLIQEVGVKDTAEMAHRLGVTMINPDGKQPNGDPYGPSLTLGAAEVSPLDMAAAFGVFPARGQQFPATPVVKITDASGRVLEDNTTRKPTRVLSEAVADNVNDVLKGVIAGGTGKGADIGLPNGSAGKTGSTENNADAWFVGYTPALSTAIWMGYSDSNARSMRNIKGVPVVFGGTIPASTWKEYMGEALKGIPPMDFVSPEPLAGDVSPGARRTPLDIAAGANPAAGPTGVIVIPPPVFDPSLSPPTPASPPGVDQPFLPLPPFLGGLSPSTTAPSRTTRSTREPF